jgi:hypothetical protein
MNTSPIIFIQEEFTQNAAKAGDVKTVKQLIDGAASAQATKPSLSWTTLKFGNSQAI